MKPKAHRPALILGLVLVLGSSPAGAEFYREYLVRGVVIDTDKQPIAGATVTVRHRGSIFQYQTETDAKGEYKAVGIPHGEFDVEVSKEGYRTTSTEWKYLTSQQEMRRVKANPVVLVSEDLAHAVQANEQLRSHLDQAMTLLGQKDIEGALAIAQKMLEVDADDPNGLFISGMCYLEQDRIDEAAAALARAAQLLPDYPPVHVRLGVCFQRQGQIDDALASYEKALALDGANAAALYNAGAMLYGAGRAAEALPYLEKAIGVGAEDANVDEMAGYCRLQAGDYEEALRHLERARERSADEAQIRSLDEVLPGLRAQVLDAAAGVE